MRVLILDSDSPLGHAVTQTLEPLGRHELVLLSHGASRWKSERQAKKAVRRAGCDAVVDFRVEAGADGGQQLHELDLKRCHWVAKACQRDKMAYLFVSSARIFSGALDRPYTEQDEPDNDESLGQVLASAERVVRDSCDNHLILRLGPVFGSEGPNLVTQMLGQLIEGGSLVLDNHLRGCPVASGDGARVISALLDQISTGPQLWGSYHYCSSDTATYYEFAEAVLAAASQYSEFGPSAVTPEEQPEEQSSLSRALDCSKIRNTFAIKQASWRSAIADLVTEYYRQHPQGGFPHGESD